MQAGHDTATTRFNDGKADPLGRFWAGTMYEPRDKAAAELFSLDCRGGRAPVLERKAGDAIIANGLAWSPDAATVYWSDTPRHTIRAWDWDSRQQRHDEAPRVRTSGLASPKAGSPACPATAAGPTARRWTSRAITTSPCLKAGACSSSRPPASCWPRSPCRRVPHHALLWRRRPARPCTSRPRATTGPRRNCRTIPIRAACFPCRSIPGLPVNFFQD
jgi:hypothetical protein